MAYPLMLSPHVVYRARAPLRLSFAGGGSELPPYVHDHGGAVLSATIGRYVFSSIRASAAADEVTFVAEDCGLAETLPLQKEYALHGEDVKLPLHRAVYNRIVRTVCDGQALPLQLHTFSDAPVGSGLGTSSTITVSMLRCFDYMLNMNLDEYALARLAHDIERHDLQLAGGYQDHYAAAFGGVNFMEFHPDGRVLVNSLRIRPAILAELEYRLIVYFTGISRMSADIIEAQSRYIASDESVRNSIHEIKQLAYRMKDDLLSGDLDRFAARLHDGWLLKRSTAAEISNDSIDVVYQLARDHGALGGKISGAGGGGMLLLLVDPQRRQEVLAQLPSAEQQVVSCHFSHQGAMGWRFRSA